VFAATELLWFISRHPSQVDRERTEVRFSEPLRLCHACGKSESFCNAKQSMPALTPTYQW
jgi:hypothetical protein